MAEHGGHDGPARKQPPPPPAVGAGWRDKNPACRSVLLLHASIHWGIGAGCLVI
ncbi:hypothetical protein [Komagataeibacter xylinus]|uniref:hypothetical protein n=1 Tax=Komagataeibacter xylinus TaxID=28448 RepID=UPI0020D0BE32|nr:hypothetical protein [Komagataeibacter xylinus]